MSFVVGFVTGMKTGKAYEQRMERTKFREYMERRGYTVVDRNGQRVPIERIVEEALQRPQQKQPGRTILVASVALVAIAVITGGSAWAAVAVAS